MKFGCRLALFSNIWDAILIPVHSQMLQRLLSANNMPLPCDFAHHNHQLKMILSWVRQWMHAWFWCTRDSCSQNWNCGLYNCFVVRSLVTLFSAYHCWCSCILWRLRANGPLCYCISLITELSCQLDASIAVCISDDSHIKYPVYLLLGYRDVQVLLAGQWLIRSNKYPEDLVVIIGWLLILNWSITYR